MTAAHPNQKQPRGWGCNILSSFSEGQLKITRTMITLNPEKRSLSAFTSSHSEETRLHNICALRSDGRNKENDYSRYRWQVEVGTVRKGKRKKESSTLAKQSRNTLTPNEGTWLVRKLYALQQTILKIQSKYVQQSRHKLGGIYTLTSGFEVR